MKFSFFQQNKKMRINKRWGIWCWREIIDSRVWNRIKISPRLYGEKLSPVEGSPAYSSSPQRSNFSYIPLRNLPNSLHEMKEKVGSAFVLLCTDDLLAGPTFLHRNTLVRPAGPTQSKQLGQGETIRTCATAVLDNFWRGGVKYGQRQTLITQTSSPKTETWELFPLVLQTFCLTLCETNTFPKVSVLERGYWTFFSSLFQKAPLLIALSELSGTSMSWAVSPCSWNKP